MMSLQLVYRYGIVFFTVIFLASDFHGLSGMFFSRKPKSNDYQKKLQTELEQNATSELKPTQQSANADENVSGTKLDEGLQPKTLADNIKNLPESQAKEAYKTIKKGQKKILFEGTENYQKRKEGIEFYKKSLRQDIMGRDDAFRDREASRNALGTEFYGTSKNLENARKMLGEKLEKDDNQAIKEIFHDAGIDGKNREYSPDDIELFIYLKSADQKEINAIKKQLKEFNDLDFGKKKEKITTDLDAAKEALEKNAALKTAPIFVNYKGSLKEQLDNLSLNDVNAYARNFLCKPKDLLIKDLDTLLSRRISRSVADEKAFRDMMIFMGTIGIYFSGFALFITGLVFSQDGHEAKAKKVRSVLSSISLLPKADHYDRLRAEAAQRMGVAPDALPIHPFAQEISAYQYFGRSLSATELSMVSALCYQHDYLEVQEKSALAQQDEAIKNNDTPVKLSAAKEAALQVQADKSDNNQTLFLIELGIRYPFDFSVEFPYVIRRYKNGLLSRSGRYQKVVSSELQKHTERLALYDTIAGAQKGVNAPDQESAKIQEEAAIANCKAESTYLNVWTNLFRKIPTSSTPFLAPPKQQVAIYAKRLKKIQSSALEELNKIKQEKKIIRDTREPYTQSKLRTALLIKLRKHERDISPEH